MRSTTCFYLTLFVGLFGCFCSAQIWENSPFPSSQHIPSGRAYHSTVLIDNKMVVFGGMQSGRILWESTIALGDLHVLDFSTMKWIEYKSIRNAPTPRYSHSSCVLSSHSKTNENKATPSIIIFGGMGPSTLFGENLFNDLYLLRIDMMVWSQPKTIGETPYKRMGHSMTLTNNHGIIVYAGLGGSAGTLNDIFSLDVNTMTWTKLNILNLPSVYGHSTIHHSDKLIVFGGTNGKTYFDDFFVIDLINLSWKFLKSTPSFSAPSSFQTFTHLFNNKFLIYGGYNGTHELENTRILEVDDNFESIIWQRLSTHSNVPTSRRGHSAVRIAKQDNKIFSDLLGNIFGSDKLFIYVFGGWKTGNENNELWVLHSFPSNFVVQPEKQDVSGVCDGDLECKTNNKGKEIEKSPPKETDINVEELTLSLLSLAQRLNNQTKTDTSFPVVSKISTLKSNIDVFSKQVQNQRENLNNLMNSLKTLHDHYDAEITSLEKLNTEVTNVQNVIEKFQDIKSSEEKVIPSIKSIAKTVKGEVDMLSQIEEDITKYLNEIKTASSQVETSQKQQKDIDAKMVGASEELKMILNDLKKVDETGVSLKKQLSDIKEEISAGPAKNQDNVLQLEKLKRLLADEKLSVNTLKDNKKTKLDQLKDLETQWQVLLEKEAKLEKFKRVSSQIQNLDKDVFDLISTISNLMQEAKDLQEEINNNNDQGAGDGVDSSSETKSKQQLELEGMKNYISKTQPILRDLRSKLEREINQVRESIDSLTKSLTESETKETNLVNRIAQIERSINDYEENAKLNNIKKQNIEDSIVTNNKDKESFESEHKRLTRDYNDLITRLNEIKSQVKTSESRTQENNRLLEEKKHTREKLKRELYNNIKDAQPLIQNSQKLQKESNEYLTEIQKSMIGNIEKTRKEENSVYKTLKDTKASLKNGAWSKCVNEIDVGFEKYPRNDDGIIMESPSHTQPQPQLEQQQQKKQP